ncbi:hypothetical protein ACFL54_00945 [Planctomycetota bacterium]
MRKALARLVLLAGMVVAVSASGAEPEQELTRREMQPILSGLQDPEWAVRETSLKKLVFMFDPTAGPVEDFDSTIFHLPTVLDELDAFQAANDEPELAWRIQEVSEAFGVYLLNQLDLLRTVNGGTGFYGGMFASVGEFGKRSLPVLRLIAFNRDYSHAIRNYAAAALGELGEKVDITPLIKIARDGCEYNYLRITSAFAAYELGDRSGLEALLADFQKYLAKNPRDYTTLSRLAECRVRMRHWDAAETLYEDLLKIYPYDTIAHYNLACMHAEEGDSRTAFEHLEVAVKYGFRDLSWLERDTSFALLRDHEEYKRLVAILKARLQGETNSRQSGGNYGQPASLLNKK